VVTGAHDVGEGQQVRDQGVVDGSGHDREGAVGERDPHALPLAAVGEVSAAVVRSPPGAPEARRRVAADAVHALPAAHVERRDDEVADLDLRQAGADLLDDSDELVPDPSSRVRHSAVAPEVRSAHARRDDAHDGVVVFAQHRVGHLLEADVLLALDESRTHAPTLPALRRVTPRRGHRARPT